MSWGLRESSARRALARPRKPWRGWLAAVALAGLGTVVPVVPAGASTSLLSRCDGYAGCSVGGYTTHGYQDHEWQSYWSMDPGDNCTNYVAYVESTAYHVATPGYLLGDAGEWAASASAHGVVVNGTPSVGAVAMWYGGDAGIGSAGHVAVVEQVAPGGSAIEISQQHISADADGYEWTRMTPGGLADGWEQWPDVFIHFTGGAAPAPVTAEPAAAPLTAPPATDLVADGSFGGPAAWSVAARSNWTTYPAGVTATAPASGQRFAATNTAVAGGGFYQDVPLQVAVGESLCADADVVTVGRTSGARGSMVLWLLGGGRAEGGSVGFGPLPGEDGWTPVTACVTATSPHTLLRVQFYDAPRTPTLGVDAVDAHVSLARNGSFVVASAWQRAPQSMLAAPAPRATTTVAYDAGHFAATSTTSAGGGFFQDVPLAVQPGDSFCADARVVTVGSRSGARGQLVLWLLGDGPAEASGVNFGPLPGASQWAPVSTCVTATTGHADLRVQFYVAPGAPALGVDAVDVHRSLLADAGFDTPTATGWQVEPASNFATYLGGGHATVALEGRGYGVTNTTAAGGGIYQDLHYAVAAGTSFCADADVVTVGSRRGARGTFVVWLLGGARPQAAAAVFGPLPGRNSWSRVSVCITAASPATDVRVQFYPSPGAPTLGVDVVDLR